MGYRTGQCRAIFHPPNPGCFFWQVPIRLRGRIFSGRMPLGSKCFLVSTREDGKSKLNLMIFPIFHDLRWFQDVSFGFHSWLDVLYFSFNHVVQTFDQSLSEVVESMNQPVTWRPGEAEFSWNLIQISAAWDDSAEKNIIHLRTLCWWVAIILQLSEHIIKLEYAI